jgi:protein-disulfide isomerase
MTESPEPKPPGWLERTAGGKNFLVAGLAGIFIGGSGVALWASQSGVPGPDRARVERIVRDYLIAHPEVIPEAMQALQDRETAGVVRANRAAYETPFAGAWAGAEDGDVVLVEFFDYACSYCRKSNADIDRLLAEDPGLKVVWREWPVLGPESEEAAEASLAAAQQGRFREFYRIMYDLGPPSERTIAEARRAAGLGPAASAAAREELDKNHRLARAIGATGTPTFVVGDEVLHGAVGYEALKAAVAKARKG